MSDKPVSRFPLDGVEIWRNPKNKFMVFQLHYSANPVKRDPTYRDTVKAGMPIKQYMQEYELQWESYAGQPVYSDFQRKIHGVAGRIQPVIGLPLLRGWDFGLTPACVIGQYVEEQLRIICEFTEVNCGAEKFSTEVLKQCAIRFPRWADRQEDWRDFIDPSGSARKDTDMGTCAQVLSKKDLICIPGPVAWEPRRQSVEHFLTKNVKSMPCFQISLQDCPVLVRGFEGGYRYPEKAFDQEPAKIKPIKDEHSHPHDALQYVCSGVMKLKKPRRATIPGPSYAWSQSNQFTVKKEGSDVP